MRVLLASGIQPLTTNEIFPDHSLGVAAVAVAESVLSIKFDYSLDASGFFNDHARRDVLQQVADGIAARLGDSLAPVPAPISSVDSLVLSIGENPATGGTNYTAPFPGAMPSFLVNRTSVAANEIVVYVGARDLPGNSVGFGGFGSYYVFGTPNYRQQVLARIATLNGFFLATGNIAFDSQVNWNFSSSHGAPGEEDFRTVAAHELAHVLGFGYSPPWLQNISANGLFIGSHAVSAYRGNGGVPLKDGQHWADSVIDVQPTIMTSDLGTGMTLSALDYAALADIGWDVLPSNQPSVQFSVSTASADESGGTITVLVTLSAVAESEIMVPFTIAGTATAGSDYILISPTPLRFAEDQDRATIRIDLVDDNVFEPDETIVITLGNPTGAILGANTQHTITVRNVTPPPKIEFSTSSKSVSESAGTMTVQAVLTQLSTLPVTAQLVVSGTVRANDFSLANTITIPAGEDSVEVTLSQNDDNISESTKTLLIAFDNVVGAELGSVQNQIITIFDDDLPAGTSRVLVPDVVTRSHVNPGDNRATALLFTAQQDATVRVTPSGNGASTNLIAVQDQELNSVGGVSQGAYQFNVTAGQPYAVIMDGSPNEITYTIESTSGNASLVGSMATNLLMPTDVNADGVVTAIDALTVINLLSRGGNPFDFPRVVGSNPLQRYAFYDVKSDGELTSIDALRVINQLARNSTQAPLGEAELSIVPLPKTATSNENAEVIVGETNPRPTKTQARFTESVNITPRGSDNHRLATFEDADESGRSSEDAIIDAIYALDSDRFADAERDLMRRFPAI